MNSVSCIVFLLMLCVGSSHADEVSVAVASNFTAPMQNIALAFERDTGHKAILSFGATGRFYAQIKNGAPYHLLLAADDTTTEKIEREGLGVPASRFTYAIGKLVLWSKQANFVDPQGDVLKSGKFARIALADPRLAPYGAAAIETMKKLDVLEALKPKFIQGENISQTYQFVATENAQLGFVALSQVYAGGQIIQGSAWIIPTAMYTPIRQDAILLKAGQDLPAAQALVQYLRSEQAYAIIRSFGYEQ